MKGILAQVDTSTGSKLVVKYDSEGSHQVFLDVDINLYEHYKKNHNYSPQIGETIEFDIKHVDHFPYTVAKICLPERPASMMQPPPPPPKKKIKRWRVSISLFGSKYVHEYEIECDNYENTMGNTMWGFYETKNNRSRAIAYYPMNITAITKVEPFEVEID